MAGPEPSEITDKSRGLATSRRPSDDIQSVMERLGRGAPRIVAGPAHLKASVAGVLEEQRAVLRRSLQGFHDPVQRTRDLRAFKAWLWRELQARALHTADAVGHIADAFEERYLNSPDADTALSDLAEWMERWSAFRPEAAVYTVGLVGSAMGEPEFGPVPANREVLRRRKQEALLAAEVGSEKDLYARLVRRHLVFRIGERKFAWAKWSPEDTRRPVPERLGDVRQSVKESVAALRKAESKIREVLKDRQNIDWKNLRGITDTVIAGLYPADADINARLRSIAMEELEAAYGWSPSDYFAAAAVVTGLAVFLYFTWGGGIAAAPEAAASLKVLAGTMEFGLAASSIFLLHLEQIDFDAMNEAAVLDAALKAAPDSDDPLMLLAFEVLALVTFEFAAPALLGTPAIRSVLGKRPPGRPAPSPGSVREAAGTKPLSPALPEELPRTPLFAPEPPQVPSDTNVVDAMLRESPPGRPARSAGPLRAPSGTPPIGRAVTRVSAVANGRLTAEALAKIPERYRHLSVIRHQGPVEIGLEKTARGVPQNRIMGHSARKASGRIDDVWLHMVALMHGGPHETANLAAGSAYANRAMTLFERLLYRATTFEEGARVYTEVLALGKPGSDVAELIVYRAWRNDVLITDGYIDARLNEYVTGGWLTRSRRRRN